MDHGSSANAAMYSTDRAAPTTMVGVAEGAWSAKEMSAMVRRRMGRRRRGR